ncbi:radical SAM protein [bacterium]|nr:radical SAM protein [bacterium]MBU1651239.1 radical SAM protein [bacterium]MBU1882048.1 radical SAM protein [bacterium]
MKILSCHGNDDLALLYVGQTADGSLLEFVESVQPPVPRDKKWVLIVSTLKGCPVGCLMCDAGGDYSGRLSKAEILDQIDHLILQRFPDRIIPIAKFKIQFARMGEPSLNDAVLEVLTVLPQRYNAPGLLPCVSTVMPRHRQSFFAKLKAIKNDLYPGGKFQMQVSLHTTDPERRASLINYPVADFAEISAWGHDFFVSGDRKIALNFALTDDSPIDAKLLRSHFDPECFLIKLTPLNPTVRIQENQLKTQIDPHTGQGAEAIIADLEKAGFQVILSLGEPEEDRIGSNCGQYVNRYKKASEARSA